jgi:hypothetical protein
MLIARVRGALGHIRGQWMGALALFLVLAGGVGYAAKATIGSSDIKNGQVKTKDLASNAVTSAKIGDGQVGTSEIADGQVKKADIDPTALPVAPGYSIMQVATGFDATSPKELAVQCPAGQKVTGGGFVIAPNNTSDVLRSYPVAADTWLVRATGTGTWQLTAYADCAG